MADAIITKLVGGADRVAGPDFDIKVGDVVDLPTLPPGAIHEILETENGD